MEKSSEQFIGDSVYLINSKYSELESRTKTLYFTYLDKNKTPEQFQRQIERLWGDIDHEFMDKQISKLKELVHNNNVELGIEVKALPDGKESYHTVGDIVVDDYFSLTPEKDFKKIEKKYIERVVRSYTRSYKSIQGKDKDIYIQNKLDVYDSEVNQIVAYYKSDGGGIARYVDVATYLSMLHNVDLTRSGWNTTLGDAEYLGTNLFIIPYHPFSCEYCQLYQNKILTKYEVENILGLEAEEQVGDILHPNCKCTLSIFWGNSQIEKVPYTREEQVDFYDIRQKVNGYSLKIDRWLTDKRIIDKYGTQKQKDKINRKISKANESIQQLVNTLPTKDLKRQVEAIYR
jgi:hypothetical protein